MPRLYGEAALAGWKNVPQGACSRRLDVSSVVALGN